jgi:hypothetical protein
MPQVAARIARVELDGRSVGTGFLVGPSALLTAASVLAPVLTGAIDPGGVGFRFDEINHAGGAEARLHPTDWRRGDRPAEHLGYALVQLSRSVGSEHAAPGPGSPRRGFLKAESAPPPPWPGRTPLVFAHCPRGLPLTLTVDLEPGVRLGAGGAEVRYATATGPGSEGAPVFDSGWNLLALHVGEGRGVPVSRVIDDLGAQARALAPTASREPAARPVP